MTEFEDLFIEAEETAAAWLEKNAPKEDNVAYDAAISLLKYKGDGNVIYQAFVEFFKLDKKCDKLEIFALANAVSEDDCKTREMALESLIKNIRTLPLYAYKQIEETEYSFMGNLYSFIVNQ